MHEKPTSTFFEKKLHARKESQRNMSMQPLKCNLTAHKGFQINLINKNKFFFLSSFGAPAVMDCTAHLSRHFVLTCLTSVYVFVFFTSLSLSWLSRRSGVLVLVLLTACVTLKRGIVQTV